MSTGHPDLQEGAKLRRIPKSKRTSPDCRRGVMRQVCRDRFPRPALRAGNRAPLVVQMKSQLILMAIAGRVHGMYKSHDREGSDNENEDNPENHASTVAPGAAKPNGVNNPYPLGWVSRVRQ